MIVISPTAPNSSYEEIELKVVVEYSGPELINSSAPLRFRYAGNPDINAMNPRRIRNTSVLCHFCVYDYIKSTFSNDFKCAEKRIQLTQAKCIVYGLKWEATVIFGYDLII